jgi:NAD(P)H-hydrate epimerase
VVVDADGLTLLSPADDRTFPARCVITPHPGEMARLLGTDIPSVESNRIETARDAAGRFGCVVVLKGPATVVAAPDGRVGINSSGGPALATGGTGDVLTGITAACLARGLEPYEAAVGAVFLHGVAGEVAGERFGAPGAIAGDVVSAIPEALRRLREGEVALPYRTI